MTRRDGEHGRPQSAAGHRELAAYLAAVALVPIFVNGFSLWQWLDTRLPPAVLASGGLILMVPVVVWGVWQSRRRLIAGRRWPWLLAAAVFAAAGYALADPAFPAKRVHIPEYVVLALVLRYAVSYRLTGWAAVIAVVVLGGLLGVHDELLQGLHPARFFGVADIVVNLLSATAGALLGQALGWASHATADPPPRLAGATGHVAAGMGFVALALTLWLTALVRQGEPTIPVWACLPLFGAGFYWSMTRVVETLALPHRLVVNLAVWLSVATVIEPLIAHVASLDFS